VRLVDRLLGAQRFYTPEPSGGNTFAVTSFGNPNNERILPEYRNALIAYQNSGVVFGVVLARMNLFTEAEFKFQDLKDKHLFGTPELAILEEPWPGATTGDLLARMEQDASLAGNAFVRRVDATSLERLRPEWVTIVSTLVDVYNPVTGAESDVRKVVGYYYEPPVSEGREPEFYMVEEVAHWSPIPDPCAEFRGMSWLTPVLREVDADLSMTDYRRAFLQNAAMPNLLIKYATKVGPDKVKRIADQIAARHGGVNNAFKTLVLDEGADPTVLSQNFEQMQFAATQAAGENRIAVAAGVPAIVAGLKEGLEAATYSNYGLAMRRFADLTMRPNWRSACGALAKLVTAPAGTRLWFDTSAISALQEGEKERADTMLVLAGAANTLITAGYTADSVKAALAASDVTLLVHSGLVSVQLQAPGSMPPALPEPTKPNPGGQP
jgi:HK97 family phage portal protein